MLVLTRNVRECVVMTTPDGTEILVHVLGVAGGTVRLGFDAPKSVRIERDNIVKRKLSEPRGG